MVVRAGRCTIMPRTLLTSLPSMMGESSARFCVLSWSCLMVKARSVWFCLL